MLSIANLKCLWYNVEMAKPQNLEQATSVLWRAAEIRDQQDRLTDPEAFDTEESVLKALLEYGASPLEVLKEKPKYLRALRIMLKYRQN